MVVHTPDPGFALFGAQALLKRLHALKKEIVGTRLAEDIEYIHRMRVASRRLRSALGLFSGIFPRKITRQWSGQCRRVTQSLGAARDLDVQISFIQGFLSQITDSRNKPGIERLLLRIRQKRQRTQEHVLTILDKLEKRGTLQCMELTLQNAVAVGRMRKTKPESRYLLEQAYSSIILRLDEMLEFEQYIPQQECIEQHHAMRIAAKRLRYIMEIFAPLYDGGLNRPLTAVRSVQEILGDIHDCDVWVAYLPLFLDKQREKIVKSTGSTQSFKCLVPGLQYLQADRQTYRVKRHLEFTKYWKEISAEKLWDELRETLCLRLNACQEPPEEQSQTDNAAKAGNAD